MNPNLEEALNAARAIGDDRMQMHPADRGVPEFFTQKALKNIGHGGASRKTISRRFSSFRKNQKGYLENWVALLLLLSTSLRRK